MLGWPIDEVTAVLPSRQITTVSPRLFLEARVGAATAVTHVAIIIAHEVRGPMRGERPKECGVKREPPVSVECELDPARLGPNPMQRELAWDDRLGEQLAQMQRTSTRISARHSMKRTR